MFELLATTSSWVAIWIDSNIDFTVTLVSTHQTGWASPHSININFQTIAVDLTHQCAECFVIPQDSVHGS